MMLPRLTPMSFYDGLDKKKMENTPVHWNSVHMSDRKKTVTCYPKQHVVELS